MSNKQIFIDCVDIKGYCDFCKEDIDGTLQCPYEDHCFYKCNSAYNKILQKISEVEE